MRFKMPAGPLTAKGPWAGLQDLSSFPNKTFCDTVLRPHKDKCSESWGSNQSFKI